MFKVFKRIRQSILDWCLSKEKIHIKDFHESLETDDCEIYNGDNLKFIEQADVSEYFTLTPTGLSSIKKSFKTVQYKVYTVQLENGMSLDCADEHVLMSGSTQYYVQDLKPGISIDTLDGPSNVKNVIKQESSENMYDLELDDINHVYYTNDILSHNTTSIAAYLLWYACFQFDKTVLVASNKNSNAMEIMQKVIYAYEELPMWLKPGTKYATKHSLEFDNGSRLFSQATTENTGRGLAISLLMLDELAFVPKRIQEEMWTSIAPTLSTGGSCIISSTPNGDDDLFSTLWRGAKLKTNDFNYIEVDWDEHPDRDEAFRKEMIGKLGELKWKQEYECFTSETLITVQDPNGRIFEVEVGEFYRNL